MIDENACRRQAITAEVLRLFETRGDSEYGGEAVTQREHALQAAMFAEQSGAPPSLIVASLLHDVGHLLHHLPNDAPEQGIDDRHETLGANWLKRRFGPSVVAPVLLHVAAKRYLCAIEPGYNEALSAPSRLSLELQGGPMSAEESSEFARHPHFEHAVSLRRFDDAAKVPKLVTPTLEHFADYIDRVAAEEQT